MTGRPLNFVAPPLEPCTLVRHEPGRHVQWVEGLTRFTGVVVQHRDRQLLIRRDDGGGDVWTSCGHVAATLMAAAQPARWTA